MSEEISEKDLPYRSEYAKSDRSSCKACKTKIGNSQLRLAVMVQSPAFDGKTPNWFHTKCFFTRNRPKSVGDIAHFESLRWDDQEKIRSMLENVLKGAFASGGKKQTKNISKTGTNLIDFRLEMAKSGGSTCVGCEEKIKKGEARAGKKNYDSTKAKMYGPYDQWHHISCFAEKREELEYYDSGDIMAGFMKLSADDQKEIKCKLPQLKRKLPEVNNGPSPKKAKPDEDKISLDRKEEMKKQNKKMFYYRDQLQRQLKKKELQDLLESNGQEICPGVDQLLDRLSDVMTFGALKSCSECENGQLVYRSGIGYQCTGNISEWTRCQYKTNDPQRKPFVVPKSYKQEYDFLKLHKYKPQKRVIPPNTSTVSRSSSNAADGNASHASKGNNKSGTLNNKPLRGCVFVLEGFQEQPESELQSKIKSWEGKVEDQVTKSTTALIIADKSCLTSKSEKVAKAEEHKVHVVSQDALSNDIKTEGVIVQVEKHSLCEWGTNLRERVLQEDKKTNIKPLTKAFLKKDLPKSMKLKMKNGGVVDPDSKLGNKAHVLKKKETVYSVVLGAVSIQDDKNSYYKLQVLEHDKKPKWYLFRSWGRIGTTIGGTKVDEYHEKHEALKTFEFHFEDKTGNRWSQRDNFQKVSGKFFIMDLDFGQDSEELKKLEFSKSTSKLDKAIQKLITILFDIESMKKAMVEFELDLTKMPLGKLSRKQIESAYKILSEVQNLIKLDSDNSSQTTLNTKFLDASNRFFTLIPHDFGMNKPPLLNNPDYIKMKLEMLNSLLDMEIAYNLLKSSNKEGKDPIDSHYENLKTDIDVLDKNCNEYKILEKYVKQTHASTHTLYTLEIEQIFKISRHGENKRFKQFQKLQNRMLLWHGSRKTNFAGILSQGLRIAPPEAPVTGYMFGKGIYFADMVSKSANYCCTSRSNNTGVLLLCEVALGDMYERTAAEYIEKLPTGKHSTKGVGKTEPDSSEYTEIDGARVPFGKGTKKDVQSDLLYNEYIVYDIAQIQAKYLFQLKFNYTM